MTIPADESHPDCCFVEDTAVVIGGRALATRPGHPSRRGEVAPVAVALEEWLLVERMAGSGTLDGGDVLQVGGVVYVGRSSRTDAGGIEALARFAAPRPVVTVPVSGMLHLRSAASPLDEATVLVEEGRLDPTVFTGVRVVTIPGDGGHGANVLRLADGRILAPEGRPRLAEEVAGAGFEVVTVDVSEFARADGGLTCLSIRQRAG